ncbi:MAG: hypothetical protein ACXIVG_13915 [Pararhodobacter sp.]
MSDSSRQPGKTGQSRLDRNAQRAGAAGDAPMTGIDPLADPWLDDALAAAAAEPAPPLPDALTQRMMAQALAEMPVAPGIAPARDTGASGRWLARMGDRLGDWLAGMPGIAGAATAGLAGLWIGLAAPGPADAVVSAFLQGGLGDGARVAAWQIAEFGADDWDEASGLLLGDAGFWLVLEAEQEGWE